MVINYIQHKEDILALKKDFIKTSAGHRRQRRMQQWTTAVVCIVSYMISSNFFYNVSNRQGTDLLIFLLIPVLLAVFFFLLMKLIHNQTEIALEKQRLKKSDFNQAGEQIELAIDEHGLAEKNIGKLVKKTKRISWNGIKRVTSDKDRYFVYYENQAALILPKKISDADDEQREIYQAFIQKYIYPHLEDAGKQK